MEGHRELGYGNMIGRFYKTFKERTKLFCNNINASVGKMSSLKSSLTYSHSGTII